MTNKKLKNVLEKVLENCTHNKTNEEQTDIYGEVLFSYIYKNNEGCGNIIKRRVIRLDYINLLIKNKKYWEKMGVDFDLPIRIYVDFTCKEDTDIDKLEKNALDILLNKQSDTDDSCMGDFRLIKLEDYLTYEDGKIYYHIENEYTYEEYIVNKALRKNS